MSVRSFDKLYIGGAWVEPSSTEVIQSISPVTEEVLATVPAAQAEDFDRAVDAAREAFDHGPWRSTTPAQRAEYILKIRDEVEKRLPEMQEAFTDEIGAPSGLAAAFHGMALDMYTEGATLHQRYPFEEEVTTPGGHGLLVQEPVGVVAAIVPWNAPVNNASMKLIPALAAGCCVIIKPAPEGAAEALMFAEAIDAVGLPQGVVSVLPAERGPSEHLVAHPGVDKVAFTGSTAAGKRIMSLCGERIARLTLELGGKSAAVIVDDVPLDQVLPSLSFAGIGHTGQVCAALTRVVVPRHRQDEVVEALKSVFEAAKVGDPRDPEVAIGPLFAKRQLDTVMDYIELGQKEGARLVTGGGRPDGLEKGWFVEPTLFADVDNSWRIAQEEIFGPVVVVIPHDGDDDAVRIANDSPFGLSGAVYAESDERAARVARRIRTGQVSVNSWGMCLTQPYGGFKQSGLGREMSTEGLSHYLETKLIQYADA